MRYVFITHSWFMQSKGWHVKESKAKTYNEAENEAKIMMVDSKEGLLHIDYMIIEIGENERLNKKNKLTFKERLTGKIIK